MLPESWIPARRRPAPARPALRKALADDRTRWARRLDALVLHEGLALQRARLLTAEGFRWVGALRLEPATRAHAESLPRLIGGLEQELESIEAELRHFARRDARCRALASIYGVGPIPACHLLAELGDARRLWPARQARRPAARPLSGDHSST